MNSHTLLMESIIPVDTPEFAIRIWKQEKDLDVNFNENVNLPLRVFDMADHIKECSTLATAIIDLPNVNAVEVRPRREDGSVGTGVVLYDDWP